MGRDITFYRAKNARDGSDEDYEARHIATVSLGSGDAWPCYLRPFFIAAYRKLQSEGRTEDVDGAQMDAIVRCCPPDNSKIDNRRVPCGFFGHEAKDFTMLSPRLKGRHDMIDEGEMLQAETQLLLDRAGLWPCVEMLLMHHRCPMVTPTIRRASKMMLELMAWLPYEDEDLKGTPYEPSDAFESYYNLADERWKELVEAFKLAASEENVIARVE